MSRPASSAARRRLAVMTELPAHYEPIRGLHPYLDVYGYQPWVMPDGWWERTEARIGDIMKAAAKTG